MRNHIAIVSEESVLAGNYKCGIGEVVDCMASALRKYYDITIVTIGTCKGGRRGGTVTLGVEGDAFYVAAAEYVDKLKPDLVHIFGRPDFIGKMTVNCPMVLTFDRWEEDIADYLDYVPHYDHVVTLSTAYANEMIAAHPEAAAWPLKGIIGAIDSGLYTSSDNRDVARAKVYHAIGKEDTGRKLIVCMGRLKPVKGTDLLIAEAEAIAAAGADLVVWGTGETEYEEQLFALHEAGVLTYHRRLCGYHEMITAIQGADFYLTPSRSEVCGLQPMKAARMGCVPIVTPVGGMAENFDESMAIFITEGIADAVQRAVNLDDTAYASMKENCLNGEWTWDTRILPWVELYGLPTAPREASTLIAQGTERASRPCPFTRKEVTNA